MSQAFRAKAELPGSPWNVVEDRGRCGHAQSNTASMCMAWYDMHDMACIAQRLAVPCAAGCVEGHTAGKGLNINRTKTLLGQVGYSTAFISSAITVSL